MLYSLDNAGPDEILRLFAKNKATPKKVFEGTYKLAKNEIFIEVLFYFLS